MTEEEHFMIEAALGHGFDPHPDEDDTYVASGAAIVALVKAVIKGTLEKREAYIERDEMARR